MVDLKDPCGMQSWLQGKEQAFTSSFHQAFVRLSSACTTEHAFAKPSGVPAEAVLWLGTRQPCRKDMPNAEHLGLGHFGGLCSLEDAAKKPPHCHGCVK